MNKHLPELCLGSAIYLAVASGVAFDVGLFGMCAGTAVAAVIALKASGLLER